MCMSTEIKVHLNKRIDRSYRIYIQPGVLQTLPKFLSHTSGPEGVFIITDSNVEKLYGRRVQKLLFEAGLEPLLLSFPAGEQSKNADVVNALHTQLLENGVRRDSVIIALGGGVVGDIAGYVAATVLRGIRFIQVPTTLLAQVDSSVGGKVGIDHALGKNLIGAFHQPAAVFIDPTVLRTLSRNEFRNGLAEVVKIAAALDKNFFGILERNAHRISKTNDALLSRIIDHSVRVKAAVVEKDEFESGLRKALNLGHTLGHAVEAASNFRIRHGEAVSVGIVAESKIAVQLGWLHENAYDRVLRLLRALKLPTSFPHIQSRKRFFTALASDKKAEGKMMRFTLLNGIGSSAIGVPVSSSLVEQVIKPKKSSPH